MSYSQRKWGEDEPYFLKVIVSFVALFISLPLILPFLAVRLAWEASGDYKEWINENLDKGA